MKKIDKSEVLKIAHIAKIAVTDQEIDPIIKQMQEVLSYAARVVEIATELEDLVSQKNINFFREGLAGTSYPEELLERAPSQEENYFVVPKIIDTK